LGDGRLLNMVMLGALLEQTGVLSLEVVEHTIEEHLPERHRGLLELNRLALRRGAELAQTTTRVG
jgi:2-oxoglutarate ferredoxin oxidoreductase subunit gamma